MRVLHVFKTYLPDGFAGVERVIWGIAEGTAARGIDNRVFTLSKGGTRAPMRTGHHEVHYAPMSFDIASTPVAFRASRQFRALATEADLIHYHFPWPMMDLWHLFAGGRNRPSIVTYHSDVVKQVTLLQLYRPLMNRFLRSVDRIVATSPNYVETSTVLSEHRDRTAVIPLGIDPATIQTVDPELMASWKARLPDRFFLFVGELRYYKGLPYLIEAARRTGLPVVLVGPGELPPAEAADLPSGVMLLGRVSDADKAALLHLAESFVFPSHLRSEAFGVALLEAAFAAKPMISCELGTGTSFANRHGETGLVVPPADPAALAAAMQTLWDDASLRVRFGAAALVRAEAMFRADQMAAAYAGLYATVIEEAARKAR